MSRSYKRTPIIKSSGYGRWGYYPRWAASGDPAELKNWEKYYHRK